MSTDLADGPRPKTRDAQSSGVAAGLALLGAVMTTIANFGTAFLVARAGAAYAGVFFAATALVTILGNSSCLGTMTGLVYFMPNALDGQTPNPRSLLMIALRPVMAASVLAAVALFGGADVIANVIADDQAAEVGSMLRVLSVAVPGWALTVALLGATRGLGSMTPTVAINQIFKPLTQLVGIAVLLGAVERPSSAALGIVWAVPVIVSAGLAFGAVWRLGGLTGSGPAPVNAGEFWSYTRPRSVSTAFQIALERIDVILVSALAGEATAGIYGTISRYITAGNFLIFSIAQATGPAIRRSLAKDRKPQAQRLLHQATGWMVLLAWPYFLLVATEADSLISLLNPDFTTGTTALAVLAVALLANAMSGPIDLTLLMLGRSRLSLAAAAAALATDIGLAWLLIPRFGIVGAACAWGAAVIVQNGLATIFVDRIGRLRAPGRGAVLAAMGAVIAVVPVSIITPDGFAGLVLTAAGAGVIHLAWIVRFAAHFDLPTLPGPAGRLLNR